jgi:O-antigen ligase
MLKKVNIKDYRLLPLYALVFSIPFKLILAPLFLTAQLLMIPFFKEKKSVFKKALIVPVLLFACYAASLTYTTDFDNGLSNVLMKLPLIIIPLLTMLINRRINVCELFNVYIFSCFIFCMIAFTKLIYFTATSGIYVKNYNFVQQSIEYYHFPTEVLMLNIALVLTLKSTFNNRIKFIFSSSFFLFVLFSGTRIGLILSVPLFFWNIFNLTQHLSNLKKLLILFLLLLTFVYIPSQSRYTKNKILDSFHYIGLFTSIETESFSKKYHNIELRQKLWKAAVKKIKESPIFGYGIGVERQVIAEELSKNQAENINLLNAHNQYLSTYVSSGVFGFMALILWMVSLLYLGVSNKNFELTVILIVVIISMFVESYLERQKGIFIITLFLSLLSKTHPTTPYK